MPQEQRESGGIAGPRKTERGGSPMPSHAPMPSHDVVRKICAEGRMLCTEERMLCVDGVIMCVEERVATRVVGASESISFLLRSRRWERAMMRDRCGTNCEAVKARAWP